MKKYLFGILIILPFITYAENTVFSFRDPNLEQRYKSLTQELRCLVCQNQNIADSHAELAQDLRGKVYEMLDQGSTDEQIVQYMTDRYGDFVLYRPPMKLKTALLWLSPVLALLVGFFIFWRLVKSKSKTPNDVPQERLAPIKNLLDNDQDTYV